MGGLVRLLVAVSPLKVTSAPADKNYKININRQRVLTMQLRLVPSLLILLGLGLSSRVAIAQPSPEPPEPESSPELSDVLPSDEAVLLRAIAEHYAGVSATGDELLVGQLPDFLAPEVLPIPNDGRVLGSIVRGSDAFDIVIEATQSPEAIIAFYDEQLLSSGWQAAQFPASTWNFTTVDDEEYSPNVFCSSAEGYTLYISAWTFQANQPTHIYLSMSQATSGVMPLACNASTANTLPPLPTLELPEGVNPSTSNSGVEDDFQVFYTDIIIATDLTSEALLSHLSQQFDQAGWTPAQRSDSDVQSQASWTYEDEQGQTWQSAIDVIKLGATDEYFLRAKAERQ